MQPVCHIVNLMTLLEDFGEEGALKICLSWDQGKNACAKMQFLPHFVIP